MALLENPKHERFAQEIAQGRAAKTAYHFAGYKGRGSAAYVGGCRLLRNDKIRGRIAEIQLAAAKAVQYHIEISTKKVVEELARIGFANIADYLTFDEEGKPAFSLSELDRQKGAGITEIITQRTKDGTVRVRIKLGNKQGALTRLLDYCMAIDEMARANKPNAQTPQKLAPQQPFDVEEMRRRYGLAPKKEEVN